ncbi:M28 family peptidase [Saprospiraceae bacterium]|nr:M28 family peptidase [Saprospiraceae bacterium]
MTKYLLVAVSILFSAYLSAQYKSGIMIPDSSMAKNMDKSNPSVMMADDITAEDLRSHLTVIAGDGFEGRETGEPGNDRAAKYIADHFKNIGIAANPDLKNGYYQPVAFTFESWNNAAMVVNGQKYRHLWDFLAFQDKNKNIGTVNIEKAVFLGYGIDDPKYSDYKRKRVKGKTIIIYAGEPMNASGNSRITGSSEKSEWSTNINKKLEAAMNNGVETVMIISDDIKSQLSANRRQLLGSKVSLGDTSERPNYPNNIYISTTIAKEILGKKMSKVIKSRDRITMKGKSRKVNLKTNVQLTLDKNVKSIVGQNVLGYIEGTDKKDELVILSAHYDHLGKRGESIYNGADDNGSGTTAVLEIAQTFADGLKKGIRPRRSMLFLLVTGEEKGLLGSAYYAERPIYPLAKTMVDINVDMVGRVDDKYLSNPNYIYVIGSDRLSTDLHKINESVNQEFTQLVMDYTYNSESDPNRYYFRSDHYNFAKNGIPAIFFFNGTHADYHQASDTVEKINFEKMEQVTKHIYHLAFELANQEKAIVVDGEVKD